jgi:hypothetical protein
LWNLIDYMMVITSRIQSSVPVEARHGKYFAIGESSVCRVPTTGIHVGHANPGIGIKVKDICVRLAIAVEEVVTSANQQAAVWQKSMAAAKQVRVEIGYLCESSCSGVPQMSFCSQFCILTLPKQNLAARENLCVYGDYAVHGHQRRPLTYHSRIGWQGCCGGGCHRRFKAWSDVLKTEDDQKTESQTDDKDSFGKGETRETHGE